MSSDGPLISTFHPLNVADAIKKDTTSSTTAVYEEEASYNFVQSTDTTVDNFQILNAMNGNNQKWMQVGVVYDNIGIFQSGAWDVEYELWSTSNATAPTNHLKTTNLSFSNNDPAESFITGSSTKGQYTMGVTDELALVGTSLTFSIANDQSINTINLGRNTTSGSPMDSGAQVEQYSSSSNSDTYHFGSEQFSYVFFDTPSSGSTTAVTGYDGKDGYPTGVTVTEQANPASDTFVYN